ncbi:unnamed protein product [Schistosoma margrebowiei]|uniref:Uncharacterized protein n=1 Tax=Schistosoma margrebowiei TaxID=48269 RepID=A0A183MEC4_9TREM|nr:unnamed protein product [Schistosoma margrebowiei]
MESSLTHVSFYLGIFSWMYLHLRVDVHSASRTQYHSLQTPSLYPLTYRVLIATCLCNGMNLNSLGIVLTCIFPLRFKTAIDQSVIGICAYCAYASILP